MIAIKYEYAPIAQQVTPKWTAASDLEQLDRSIMTAIN